MTSEAVISAITDGGGGGSGSIGNAILLTFLASIRSVGTACTLAAVGIYLHQGGYVVGPGKRTLALISQQVTIPLLLFTKILYCNQDWSDEPCPNVTESLKDVWVLLVWPILMCGSGLLIGYICAKMAKVPPYQINGILVAVAFGNCTGLPITLLTVIHSNFPKDTHMGQIDPTLFLSVYLITYPILQWGIGGWLLAPPEQGTTTSNKKKKLDDVDDNVDNKNDHNDHGDVGHVYPGTDGDADAITDGDIEPGLGTSNRSSTSQSGQLQLVESLRSTARSADQALANNVLNRTKRMSEKYQITHRGLESIDASLYMSVPENLNRWGRPVFGTVGSGNNSPTNDMYLDGGGDGDGPDDDGNDLGKTTSHGSVGLDLSTNVDDGTKSTTTTTLEQTDSSLNYIPEEGTTTARKWTTMAVDNTTEMSALLPPSQDRQQKTNDDDTSKSSDGTDVDVHLCTTFLKVVRRCLQPPVVGALSGLFIASFPALRGIFVDIVDRSGDAPLQWFFDGLYTVGQAAVPLNMMILGSNLSASYMLDTSDAVHKEKLFSPRATWSVVIAKMVVMPIIGFISAYLLTLVYHVPEEIAGSFYLVLLMVFLCPTANNVMVMVELAGSGSREGMARIIAYQYMVAPLFLSVTVSVAVFMASSM